MTEESPDTVTEPVSSYTFSSFLLALNLLVLIEPSHTERSGQGCLWGSWLLEAERETRVCLNADNWTVTEESPDIVTDTVFLQSLIFSSTTTHSYHWTIVQCFFFFSEPLGREIFLPKF